MFTRLSWETPPEELSQTSEHIHGPNCDCNPLSALRVQYLRLIHNFFDRDFHNNSNKTHMMAPEENRVLSKYKQLHLYRHHLLALYGSQQRQGLETDFIISILDSLPEPDMDRSMSQLLSVSAGSTSSGGLFGTLRSMMKILKGQEADSIYRFWLTSCLESFIRGLGHTEQVYVSSSGILSHLLEHICCDYAPSPSDADVPLYDAGAGGGPSIAPSTAPSLSPLLSTSTLQSLYDFLGEIIKYNFEIIETFEKILLEKNLMTPFLAILSRHLIDTNVFLRALFVTFDSYHEKYQRHLAERGRRGEGREMMKKKASADPVRDETFVQESGQENESQGNQIAGTEWKMMANNYYYLPPSCPHRHVLYESLATGLIPQRGRGETVKTVDPETIRDVSLLDHPVASVGYLSHSWIHFQPEMISSEASFQLQQYQELVRQGYERRKRGNQRDDKTSSLSQRSQFHSRKINHSNKKKKGTVTEQRVDQKKPSSPTRPPFSSLSLADAFSTLRNIFCSPTASTDIHRDPTPAPDSVTQNGGLPLVSESTETERREMDVVVSNSASSIEPVLYLVTEEIKSSEGVICETDPVDEGGIFEWTLPPSVRYLSSYLEQQKEHILYGLMTIVSLRSINHENICCINTSLLIFLYAHKRYPPPLASSHPPLLSLAQAPSAEAPDGDQVFVLNQSEQSP
jgi:hypothetical protein